MDNYLHVTVSAEELIQEFVSLARSSNKTVRMSNLMRAYGVFALWDSITKECQQALDAKYLIGLIPTGEVDYLLLESELARRLAGI